MEERTIETVETLIPYPIPEYERMKLMEAGREAELTGKKIGREHRIYLMEHARVEAIESVIRETYGVREVRVRTGY